MTIGLFEKREKFGPLPELTDEETRDLIKQVYVTFSKCIDERPVDEVTRDLSLRATNIIKRNNVRTVGELALLAMRAQSPQGVAGAGRLVLQEWQRALNGGRA